MTYTLRFSDAAKTETIVVPDMPPGINTIDTSLSLVGRNYPNYGEKIAENFLHLLENFAGPLPPENPIEGQLWYDTSDPNNKILRIMDGTAESTRWPSANGIYQQGTDPKTTSAALKVGDIWVDTQNNLLKIYHSGNWTVVGPSISSGLNKTGVEPAIIKSTTNTDHNVVLSYVNGDVVAITANNQFIPKEVIDGFTVIRPGVNISANNNSILNGTADLALNLKINNQKYSANRVLIKDDPSLPQVITGRLFFQTPSNQLNSEGRDGIVIDTGSLSNNTYIQFYKFANDAVILNNTVGGKIIFKTKPTINSSLITGMVIENKSVAINTGTNSAYALDINGALRVSNNITITSTSTNAFNVFGTTLVGRDLIVENSLRVKNQATITNLLTVGANSGDGTIISPTVHDVYDIGSTTKYFRSLYVTTIGSTGSGTTLYGRVIGNATGLEKSSEFRMQGQVTATPFIFAGTGTSATFVTALTSSAITSQPSLFTATQSLNILVVDTSTSAAHPGLRKISRLDFLRDFSRDILVLPEDYGAVGDGVIDDSIALQTAIDTGKPVYLSKGKTYYYTTGLSITSSFQRFGGPGILRPEGNIDGVTITGGSAGVEVDLTFDAPNLSGSAVRVDNADRVTIKKLYGIDIGSISSSSSVLYVQKSNTCVVEWLWAVSGGKGITWYGSDTLRSDILQINFAVINCDDSQYGLDWDGNCHSLEIDYLGLVGTRGVIIRNTSGGSTFPAIGKFNHIEIDYPTDHGIQITAGLDYDFNMPYVLGAGSTIPGSVKSGMRVESNINDYQVRISGGKFIGNTGYGIENLGGVLYFDGTTDLSNNALGRSTGTVWTTVDRLTLNDDQFYLEKINDDPTVVFASSSTISYDRSIDQFNFTIATTGTLALNNLFVQALKPVIMPTYTVATLPLAGLVAGMKAFVSDCTTTTFYTSITGLGGGSFYVPVFCDNSGQWRIG